MLLIWCVALSGASSVGTRLEIRGFRRVDCSDQCQGRRLRKRAGQKWPRVMDSAQEGRSFVQPVDEHPSFLAPVTEENRGQVFLSNNGQWIDHCAERRAGREQLEESSSRITCRPAYWPAPRGSLLLSRGPSKADLRPDFRRSYCQIGEAWLFLLGVVVSALLLFTSVFFVSLARSL